MKGKNKIGWKILFWLSTIILALFLLFMLVVDVSGSMASTIGGNPISWIDTRVYLFIDLFSSFYVIPLLIDIIMIVLSRYMIKKDN